MRWLQWLRQDDHWFWVVCLIGIVWWLVHDAAREIRIEQEIRWWRKQRER